MKEFLESLEIGEEKIKLSKEEVKFILAENGKVVKTETEKAKEDLTAEIETYKKNVADLQDEINKLPKSDEIETLQKKVKTMEEAEAERIANENKNKEDEILTTNIKSVFGEQKFVNDYTRNALINDIKNALNDPNNKGKSAKDLFEELTKDKDGIFVNPNSPQDMNGMNQNISTNVTKEVFDKMGYQDRLTLKQENPDLYQSFTK